MNENIKRHNVQERKLRDMEERLKSKEIQLIQKHKKEYIKKTEEYLRSNIPHRSPSPKGVQKKISTLYAAEGNPQMKAKAYYNTQYNSK